MSRRAALSGALLITLATPATWPLALAAFLLRGGLLLVVLPIVVLPSPVGLGNLLAPTLMALVLGGGSVGVVLIVGTLALALAVWVVVGGLIAASLEAESARIVARDREDEGADDGASSHPAAPGPSRFGEASRVLAVRLLAHLPTGLAVVWGSARLVSLAYRELTSPFDVATPIALRVLRAAPEVIVAIAIVWTIGEIVGAIAARRIALGGAGAVRALRDAVVSALRHPLPGLIGFGLPTLTLLLVLASSALAAAAAWETVRVAMRSSGDPFSAAATVVLFVAVWIGGLLLIGVTSAWRAAVWSVAHRDLERGRHELRQVGSG